MIPRIEIESGRARAAIAPTRGALVTRWSYGGEDLLYLDRETFVDKTKNVRGGIPVLFPSPGKLTGDRYPRGEMKQHGFARNASWDVVKHDNDAVVLALEDDAVTRAQYPFAFRAELGFSISGETLRITQRVKNKGSEAMPFGFGFHPYFAVPASEKRGTTIETNAKRAFDNVTKKTIDLHGIDLTNGEVDLHLLDHGCTESEIAWNSGTTRVRIRGSENYTHWVVWTQPGKDFVCLEPWTCPGDALNTGDRLITLPPGETWEGFVDYTYVRSE
ncbi:MAG: aldose epimerase family protein [Polyangiales bacterium]